MIFPRKIVKIGCLSAIIRGVYLFFKSLYVFFESFSYSYLFFHLFFENKKTPLFVKITKRGVSNDNPYFPFDTVIRLTAR